MREHYCKKYGNIILSLSLYLIILTFFLAILRSRHNCEVKSSFFIIYLVETFVTIHNLG